MWRTLSSDLVSGVGGALQGQGKPSWGGFAAGAPILPDWSVSLRLDPTGQHLHPALWAWQGLWVASRFGQCQEAAADPQCAVSWACCSPA